MTVRSFFRILLSIAFVFAGTLHFTGNGPGFDLPTSVGFYGVGDQGNANEKGTFTFRTGVMETHIRCVHEHAEGASLPNTPGTQPYEDIRAHIIFTMLHEWLHGQQGAPERDLLLGHHYAAGSRCLMDATTSYRFKGGSAVFKIPSSVCTPTADALAAGSTAFGGIHCGDFQIFDPDRGTEGCLPAAPAP